MKPHEAAKILAILQAAFPPPRFTISEETAQVYETFLADLEADDVRAAVATIIRTSVWPPTVAEIRNQVAAAHGLLAPAEAWAFCSAFGFSPDRWPSPEIKLAAKMSGGSWGWNHAENMAAFRNTFLESYTGLRNAKLAGREIDGPAPEPQPLDRYEDVTPRAKALAPAAAPVNVPVREKSTVPR